MTDKKCRTCRFYDQDMADEADGLGVDESECHAHPPVLVRDVDGGTLRSHWVKVIEDEWCGEWQAIEPVPVQPKRWPTKGELLSLDLSGRAANAISALEETADLGDDADMSFLFADRGRRLLLERNVGETTHKHVMARVREWQDKQS